MLNPIVFTEKVVGDFLKYQLTTYPLADTRLYQQMRRLLNLEETRNSPLLKGPYISLSPAFREGPPLPQLIKEGQLHSHIGNLAPFPVLYGHQESAIRAIAAGKTTVISTGTGSGKTECFLYPIISRCLELRDQEATSGISAVIVYPMNALAEDQTERIRELLAGTGISFGLYIGKTPEKSADASGRRLSTGASRDSYRKEIARRDVGSERYAIYPAEERVSREEMRSPEGRPRILLTNVKQLELLLTRVRDIEMFDEARLDYLVFDEAHTFSGAEGAETACLIRRLRAFCGNPKTVCIAASATIVDTERGPDAGRNFASRFFGVPSDSVALVGEEYEPHNWQDNRSMPPAPAGDPATQLRMILEAVEKEDGTLVSSAYKSLSGHSLDSGDWQQSLYDKLSAIDLIYEISASLATPRLLMDLVENLSENVGRQVSEEEILCWLALGAASRSDGRPLLRPVVHVFTSGVSGAVVTFPKDLDGPRLWLSADAAEMEDGAAALFRLAITTCTTCGQHYFPHFVADLVFTGDVPGGGEAIDDRRFWSPLEEPLGGRRVVLVDRLISQEDTDYVDADAPGLVRRGVPVYFCRACGALHPQEMPRCDGCGVEGELVRLFVLRETGERPGRLTRCVACGARGGERLGEYREPARPVRAVAVADVHVLAQNMLQHADRKRLLVFADNRQDAAFQAGWMQDHARRFRLRALMFERIKQGPVSIGDLSAHLDDKLDADDELSLSLAPEVWRVQRKESAGHRHQEERKRFLRIQVFRELTTAPKQRLGLEPWGRLRVEYLGIDPEHPFIREWSALLSTSPDELAGGISALLDYYRRSQSVLLDREGHIFSRLWLDGDYEIQRGYLSRNPAVPKGLKLEMEPGDENNRIVRLLSQQGETVARHAVKRWGVPRDNVNAFIEALWQFLTQDLGLLAAVTLKDPRGRSLRGSAGARQIDADKLVLRENRGLFRCKTCRRSSLWPTPMSACLAYQCDGTMQFGDENPDDYDLMVLDQQFTPVLAREHSGQTPATLRDELERAFKSSQDGVNTLVCTPTLELGVDIGALDSVLMRNVPPLPSNYWQRAGRAGRRHRMAVNLTYARQASHDRAYFVDPLKLLQGLIQPPRFNLQNELMIRKHVHAASLTILYRLTREGSELPSEDRTELIDALRHCFPPKVKGYLFDAADEVRNAPLDVSQFAMIVSKHEGLILDHLTSIFSLTWPLEISGLVTRESLVQYVRESTDRLADVIRRIWLRLQWALDQMRRLDDSRRVKGTLDPDEDALFARCDRLVKRLKGTDRRRRTQAEGHDDINTYSVLAAEGFLPGYGLETGSILVNAQLPRTFTGIPDFDLRRAPALAVREEVPGNLIYANGHRFVPRYYHLEPVDPIVFQIDLQREAISEVGTARDHIAPGLGSIAMRGVPICDVDLPHFSGISDEEEHRFQMGVSVIGYEQGRHAGGRSFEWGAKTVQLRHGLHLRLVNVGPSSQVRAGTSIGYPVCLVCGQSRSPFSSQTERDAFASDHRDRCAQTVEPTAFYADIVADSLCIQSCADRREAYSTLEALRLGASLILDMETEDLQIIVLASGDAEAVDALLYDPMPGGSGLIEQMVERWTEVITAAAELVRSCPGGCDTACVDCLLTFRNAFYHRYLDRHVAERELSDRGGVLEPAHEIPARQSLDSAQGNGESVNPGEDVLRAMLLRAGFPEPITQQQIDIGPPYGQTTPDYFYNDPFERSEGICIYLDGLSTHIHGNPVAKNRDQAIRTILENEGYDVLAISATELTDRGAMSRHFYRLARKLLDRERAIGVRDETNWFD